MKVLKVESSKSTRIVAEALAILNHFPKEKGLAPPWEIVE